MRRLSQLALSAALVLSATVIVDSGALVDAATAPPAFGYGTPTFADSVAPPTEADGTFFQSDNSGEPSIGVNWQSGAAMYMASTDTYRLTFNGPQSNPVNWTDVSSPYSIFNLDPILATDHGTGTTFAGGDNGACAVMSKTTVDGGYFDQSKWTPATPCPVTADHPTVGTGPFAGTPPLNATAPFVTYFCQQSDLDHCSHSVDGGTTWSPSVPTTACAGLHGHLKVSPDGTAYLPSVNCVDADGNLAVGAMTSTDNGTTWGGFGIKGATEPKDGFDPSVATDASNRVYESWARAGDYHPVITWSDDHGQSWHPQVELGTDLPNKLVATTFQAAVAGDGGPNGRAAVAYLGTYTGNPNQDPFTSGFNGVWYLFVSYTYDDGATWHTVQADPNPVQRGEIDAGGTTTAGQRNLLDFMDANLTKDGRVVVAYANGCLAPDGTRCTDAAGSTHARASVAYQTTGEGLFSAYDVTPVTAPAAPTLTATAAASTVNLGWTVPDNGGSAMTGYQIYRGLAAGAETPYASVGSVTSYADTAVSAGTTYYYRVAATNAIGTGAPSAETSAIPTTVPSAATLTATAGKVQVSLAWTTPATGGAPITGWTVYRATASGAEQPIQTISSGTSYVDNTVTGGTTYYYEVAALNRNGTGALSPEVSVAPKKGR